tara:strand:+ start:696 stop:965 length:270 start_codon:yes stop_codon:yes gene_type:complete
MKFNDTLSKEHLHLHSSIFQVSIEIVNGDIKEVDTKLKEIESVKRVEYIHTDLDTYKKDSLWYVLINITLENYSVVDIRMIENIIKEIE